MKSILFLFTIVILFSNENKTYSFKTQYQKDEIVKYRTESMLDFNFGSFSNQNNSDYKMTEKYLGEEDGFILIEKTCTDMISTIVTLGEMSVDSEGSRLVGIPYIIFVDSSGLVSDIETEYIQFEEQIRSKELDMAGLNNYIFPFGEDAVDIKVGESWNVEGDSIPFFPGDGEFENYMIVSATFTLDKVKEKGGKSTAFITAKYDISVENMIYQQAGRLFEGNMSGSGKSWIRFDLRKAKRILDKQDISMKWNLNFEDKHVVENMNLATKTKWTK